MERAAGLTRRLIEFVMVALMGAMTIMVFGNVVLRYGFHSGLRVSEEMSRYFFVWLTFVGAVLAFAENAHLGVETMVRMFGRRGRLACLVISNLIVLLCIAIMFWGTWVQFPINATMVAPVTGLPMAFVYGITFFTAVGVGLIAIVRIYRAVTGRITQAELDGFVGEFADEPPAGRHE